jgi:hypothetical protein
VVLVRHQLSKSIVVAPDSQKALLSQLSLIEPAENMAAYKYSIPSHIVILKPDPLRSRLQHMASNEFACMRLAKAIGLPTAEIRMAWIPEPIVLLRRFDRLVRRHRSLSAQH